MGSSAHLRVRSIESLHDLAGCHMVVVLGLRLEWLARQKPLTERQGLLLVADLTAPDLDQQRLRGLATVALVRQGARITLEINMQSAREAGFRISSELLKVG